ncbi:MAG: hypothetical protein GOVbin2833_25 [Prokaryotic dsDNA virus sp.]|nr:MAG: hypothetical protein GOVbin2833_25 [Prokaryotic dsDNA virus sp.]|tara:strand:- start:73 stop:393 length:321 start_codon:yes stop_codon:yes gene_type:complete
MDIGHQQGARDAAREADQRLRIAEAWMEAAAAGQPPRQDQLAEDLGLSVHQIGRALRWLESRGVAVVSDRRRAKYLVLSLEPDHPIREGLQIWLDQQSAQNRREDG